VLRLINGAMGLLVPKALDQQHSGHWLVHATTLNHLVAPGRNGVVQVPSKHHSGEEDLASVPVAHVIKSAKKEVIITIIYIYIYIYIFIRIIITLQFPICDKDDQLAE